MLLELCVNQTLNDLVRRRRKLTELETRCYILQIIEGLRYLHEHRVIHRDLKLSNLFLSEKMELKIADFGLAAKLEFVGEKKRTICGTPNYIAPEILDGRRGHSYEADIWSLGVIVYTMLVGKPPFETQDINVTYRRIKMNIYSFPDGCGVSEEGKSLVQRILTSDPAKRPSLDEIATHLFFALANTPKLMPASTLACPPSAGFLSQYASQAGERRLAAAAAEILGRDLLNTNRDPIAKKVSILREPMATTRFRTDTGSSKDVEPSTKVRSPEKKLASICASKSKNADPEEITKLSGPSVWVKKWVDYSSKYGVGYLLSNGSTGVFFNDSSKIVLEPAGIHFDYLEKDSKTGQDTKQSHVLLTGKDAFPKGLQKKVTLLVHFRSYLVEAAEGVSKLGGTSPAGETVYVKKCVRTHHAILFRLSNKVVQVNFNDDTELLFDSGQESWSKVVTYVSKTGERLSCLLGAVSQAGNHELASRLKYTKDVISQMLKPRKQVV